MLAINTMVKQIDYSPTNKQKTPIFQGKRPFSRRCLRCRYNESPRAGTAFDKLMFSIHIAFHILYRLSSNKKGRSALELPKSLDCGRKPAGLSSGRFSK
jgi:hypothetical protein